MYHASSLGLPTDGQAQENDLKFFLVERLDGKPLGKIRNMTQDPRGYMWFAGEDKGSEQSGLGCLYKFDGNRITAFRHDSENPNSLGGVNVNSVFADNAGMIWIGMNDAGLDQFNPATGAFRHFRHAENDPGSVSGEVTPILKDHQGRLWVGTNNGLDQLDEKTGKFIHYRHDPKNPKSLSSNFVWNLYEDRAGTLWVATGFPWFNQHPEDGGLNRMEPDGTFTRFKHDPNDPHSLISNKVRAMFEDSRGVFWVGTSGDGLHTMDRKTGRFERHTYDPAKPDKLSRPPRNTSSDFAYNNDQVTFIQEDIMGSIWIGTMQSGLNRYDTLTKKITHYQRSNGFPDNSGWNGYQSRDGVLWITTEEANLYRVDPFRQPINHTKTDGSGKTGMKLKRGTRSGRSGGTSSILEDKNGYLWVGTWGHGLQKFDQQKRLVHKFENDPSDPTSLFDNGINFIFQEQEDTLWICTNRGIGVFDVRTQKFSKFHPTEMFASLDTSRVMHILNDNGLKWISTRGNGLFRYDANSNDVKHYIPDPGDPGSIGTKDLLKIHKDKLGTLWFGSWEGGLNRLDPGTDQFRHYFGGYNILSFYEDNELFLVGTDKGLFSYNKTNDSFSIFQGSEDLIWINGMIEGDEDNLWVATNSRIVKVNKKGNEFFVYGTKFGISPQNLTPGSSMVKIKNGQILKGTFDGFHYFTPAELVFKSPPTQILISDFSVNSLTVLTDKEGPLLTSVEDVSETKLSHDENNFSFDFGSDDYRTQHGVRYYTMLENYDKTWREPLGDMSTSYFYVNPGDYVFKIMIYNNDGVKTVKALAIHIDPPWWKTWWAYTVYVLLAAGMLAGARRAIIQRERLKSNLKLEQLEGEKKHVELEKSKEIDRMKTTFFTNISHEFRTPLTLIKGPAQNLLAEFSSRPTVKKQVKLIQHNADLLLKLVNQLLDLAKLEAGTVEVNAIKVDLNAFLNMIIDSFSSYAKEKEIDLQCKFPEIRYQLSLDKDKMEAIITNLLGNAVKFTSSGGHVDLNAKVNVADSPNVAQLVVTVSDTGIGIPKNRGSNRKFLNAFTR